MDPQPKDTRHPPATFSSSQNSPHNEIQKEKTFDCSYTDCGWEENFGQQEKCHSLSKIQELICQISPQNCRPLFTDPHHMSGKRPNQLFCPSCPFRAQELTELKAHELAHNWTQSVCTGNWNPENFANFKTQTRKSISQNRPEISGNSNGTLHAATGDHQILQGASTKNEFRCGNCSKTFKNKSNLRQHMKKSREGAIEFLKEKRKTLKGDEPLYHCTICSYRSKRKSNLKSHVQGHSDQKPFHCPIEGCKYRAKWQKNLRTHSRVIHNFELPRKRLQNKENLGPIFECETETDEVETNNSGLAFACMWCDFIGDSELSALEHARQHTAVGNPLDQIH